MLDDISRTTAPRHRADPKNLFLDPCRLTLTGRDIRVSRFPPIDLCRASPRRSTMRTSTSEAIDPGTFESTPVPNGCLTGVLDYTFDEVLVGP